jgi:hypothetical protein
MVSANHLHAKATFAEICCNFFLTGVPAPVMATAWMILTLDDSGWVGDNTWGRTWSSGMPV